MKTDKEKKEEVREFLCVKDDKSLIALTVRLPSKRELEAADMEYSAQFNNALLHRLPTQVSMLRRLRQNETIDPDLEAEIGTLTTEVRAMGKRLREFKYSNPDDRAKDEVTQETNSERLNSLSSELDSFLEHTADNKAAQAQRNFLVACVIEYGDGDKKGERLWESVDDLLAEDDGSLTNRCVYEYMILANGLPSKWDEITKKQQSPAPPADKQADKQDDATKVDDTTSKIADAADAVDLTPKEPTEPPAGDGIPRVEVSA